MKRTNAGFTMIELLVVLIIIAILAAVATPLFLANTNRARASEAVAAMSLIRQAMRDYGINNNNTYFNITTDANTTANGGHIQNGLPTTVTAAGVPTPATAGLNVNTNISRYFSNHAYTVTNAPAAWTSTINGTTYTIPAGSAVLGTPALPINFLIAAFGSNSRLCTAGDTSSCATNAGEVATFGLFMDNTGRTFVSYDAGVTWAAY